MYCAQVHCALRGLSILIRVKNEIIKTRSRGGLMGVQGGGGQVGGPGGGTGGDARGVLEGTWGGVKECWYQGNWKL